MNGWHFILASELVILALVWVFPTLYSLRGYVIALVANAVGNLIRTGIESTPAWMTWAASHPQYQWIFVDAVIGLLPGILMALTCFASCLKRRDLYLVKGDLNAPSNLLIRLKLKSWDRLVPPLGKGQSLWLTSVFFGLAHWFGHPSGPTGVILAGIAGWVWARSMLETKGFTWPWLIHAAQDVVILSFIIMAG